MNYDGGNDDEAASDLAEATSRHTGPVRVEGRQVDGAAGSFSCVLYHDRGFDHDSQVCWNVDGHGHRPIDAG